MVICNKHKECGYNCYHSEKHICTEYCNGTGFCGIIKKPINCSTTLKYDRLKKIENINGKNRINK